MEDPVGALGNFKAPRGKEIFSELVPQSELEAREGVQMPSAPETPNAISGAAFRRKRRAKVDAQAQMLGHVHVSVLSFSNMHESGDLFINYLKARKQVFIDQKGWHLPEEEGMEFDQYDTPQARWVVLHQFGEILAGVRIAPTTAQCGQHSYMIRDAQRGLLDGLPYDVLFFEAPVDENIWEGTRIFVNSSVPAERRVQINALLFRALAEAARDVGATHLLGIVPANYRRWMSRLGLSATPVGPAMMIDGEKVQAALMKVTLDDAAPGLH